MSSQSYVAHESFWTDFKMWFSMIRVAIFIGIVIQFIIMYFALSSLDKNLYLPETHEKLPTSVFMKYHLNHFGTFDNKEWSVERQLLPYAKGWPQLPGKVYNQMIDYATDAYHLQQDFLSHAFHLSFFSYLVSLLYIAFFILLAKKRNKDRFIRGAQISSLDQFNEKLAADAAKSPHSVLKIGDTILPYEMESKHMLILGTSGSGKGVLINQLIHQINHRKITQETSERCIFYDLKGEFVQKQFTENDYLFSPFDTRSVGWNIFNEIEALPDFDIMTKSLFIAPDAKDAYWYNCAGDVFKAGLIYLKLNNTTSNKDLWNFFSMSVEEIIAEFKRLPLEHQGAIKHIDKSDAPASASIISILQERIQFFQYLTDLDGDFSFRKYIRNKTPLSPNLYILNIEKYSSLFKPLMTLCIDTMIREALSLEDNLNRRIWFVIDELGTLYKMDSVMKLETIGRSKGACLICANQDLGKIEDIYGQANLKTFFNNFNTNFTFRIREPQTAEFLSKAIGEQQIIKTSQSRQMSPTEIGDRRSENDQEKIERLFMPVEFLSLQDLRAVVNIAGYGISTLDIPPIFFKEKNPHFLMRTFHELGRLDENDYATKEIREEHEESDTILPFKIQK